MFKKEFYDPKDELDFLSTQRKLIIEIDKRKKYRFNKKQFDKLNSFLSIHPESLDENNLQYYIEDENKLNQFVTKALEIFEKREKPNLTVAERYYLINSYRYFFGKTLTLKEALKYNDIDILCLEMVYFYEVSRWIGRNKNQSGEAYFKNVSCLPGYFWYRTLVQYSQDFDFGYLKEKNSILNAVWNGTPREIIFGVVKYTIDIMDELKLGSIEKLEKDYRERHGNNRRLKPDDPVYKYRTSVFDLVTKKKYTFYGAVQFINKLIKKENEAGKNIPFETLGKADEWFKNNLPEEKYLLFKKLNERNKYKKK